MMFLLPLITTTLLHMTDEANLVSSGVFLVRIASLKQQHVRYCLTELPYLLHKTSDDRCLKFGELDVTNRTETALHFRLTNMTAAYVTITFEIYDVNGGENRKQLHEFSYRTVIDGGKPTQRTALANGMVFNFLTICNRPYYGLMCAQYCVESEDAHHVCDSTGKKVCLFGWTGKNCTIAAKDDVSTYDFTTPLSTLSSSPKSTGASLSPNYQPVTFESILHEPRTTSTHSSTTSWFALPTAPRPPIRKGYSHSSSTSYPAGNQITTAVATSLVITSNVLGWYSIAKILAALLVTSMIPTAAGFLIRKLMRSPWIQNLLNDVKTKISMTQKVQVPKRCKVSDKTSKIFTVDLKGLSQKSVAYDNEKLDARYSLQPTGEPSKSGKQLSLNDTSMFESNSYHEIDSFLLSSTADTRFATLV